MHRPQPTSPTAHPQSGLSHQDPHGATAMQWLMWIQEAPHDKALREACQAWQQASPAHARAWRKAERVWQLSGQLATTSYQHWPRRHRRRNVLLGSAVAACLALVMVLLPWFGHGELSNGKGAPRQIVLEDGSQVWLMGDSTLRSHFSEQQRHLELLQGEAFFEVTPDAARPFTVQAGDNRIEVTGTAFSVSLHDTRLEVAVEHGSVRVEDPGQQTLLKRGELIHLNGRDTVHQRGRIAPELVATWRHQQLVADDQSIGELLEQLRPQYPGMIVMKDAALAEEHVTGVYNLKDLPAALEALVQPHGGKVQRWSPYLLVISR
ncbi:MAG: FecR family protein [Pseudomonas sp.]